MPDARTILTHTRRLSIVAIFHPQGHHRPDDPRRTRFGTSHSRIQSAQGRNCDGRIARVLEGEYFGEESIPRTGFYAWDDWTPIVDLVRRIPRLHDVNIVVFKGGPVELFEALSQYHPTCRVSIFTTLTVSNPFGGELFTVDKLWLSSPMLYAVQFSLLEHPSWRRLFEHPDRVIQEFTLQAPQIREISFQIIIGHDMNRDRFNENINPQAKSEPPEPARIETMSWSLQTKMTAEKFRVWHSITDFGVLKSWTIGCIEDSMLLQTMVDIHPFRQLRRFTLALFPPEEDGLGFWRAAEMMFNSLPPLTYLYLLGMYTPKFLNDVVRHKHRLTLLEVKLQMDWNRDASSITLVHLSDKGNLGPIFTTEDILELADQCPSLQKLRICVQLGLETDIWSALGCFPCLKELDLVLNCLPQMGANRMPVPPRDLSDFGKSLRQDPWSKNYCPTWYIRDCMINCAISESFAKALFTQIRACQDPPHLIQLVIHPLYGQLDQYSCFADGQAFIDYAFFDNLAPGWTVKRDTLTGIHATREKPFNPARLNSSSSEEAFRIFRSIWQTSPEI
ncbi:hypothetical protein N7486_005774 [Penicillium sp. IBT 16267x]|nr:hypothetical protein N7486_005774 [Penicillium sp. IBT 16267x]